MTALYDRGDAAVAYVYQVDAQGIAKKPYLVSCEPWPGLPEMLRDKYGGGEFRILIRSGRAMKFSGRIAIEMSPLRRQGGD